MQVGMEIHESLYPSLKMEEMLLKKEPGCRCLMQMQNVINQSRGEMLRGRQLACVVREESH